MGKRRDIGLGGLSLVSLAEAREEATRLRKIARQQGDPLEEQRKEQRVVPTFAQAAREVHKTHRHHGRTPNMRSNGLTR